MKIFIWKNITRILLVASLSFVGCAKSDHRIYSVEKNDLYGYVNAHGDTVVKCLYTLCFTDTITRIGFVADQDARIRCFDNQGKFLFFVLAYDNGPDEPSEGLFRIVGNDGRIGYADTLGNIVIAPQYKFAYPFVKGKAKVADRGHTVIDRAPYGDEHETWVSDKWYYITR